MKHTKNNYEICLNLDVLKKMSKDRETLDELCSFLQKFIETPNPDQVLDIHRLEYSDNENVYAAKRSKKSDNCFILIRDQNTFYAVNYDSHDKIYKWAQRKQFKNNVQTPIPFCLVSTEQKVVHVDQRLFDGIDDDTFLEIGFKKDQLPFVRSLASIEDFIESEELLPEETYEYLEGYLEGEIDQEQLRELLEGNRVEPEVNKIELPLEEWRTSLHPRQQMFCYRKTYNGPTAITGMAGTGKTVVAINRAKFLAQNMSDNEISKEFNNKILFTTFNRGLANDIKEILSSICDQEEADWMRFIEVTNIDNWVYGYLKNKQGSQFHPPRYDNNRINLTPIRDAWSEAIERFKKDHQGEKMPKNTSDIFNPDFLQEELEKVITANDCEDLEDYLKASRIGRKKRLSRNKHAIVWDIYRNYLDVTRERGITDLASAKMEARKIITEDLKKLESGTAEENTFLPFLHVVLDESQDLDLNSLKLIRLLAGKPHPNDIFLVGDPHQRIYQDYIPLSHADIHIRGRSLKLDTIFRTSKQIHNKAFKILEGIPFDDLNNFIETNQFYETVREGPEPELHEFNDKRSEIDFVLEKIEELKSQGVKPEDICIVMRKRELLNDLADLLDQREVEYYPLVNLNEERSYETDEQVSDKRNTRGIRIATLHRVKGLEFEAIFLMRANDGIIPPASIIKDKDEGRKQKEINKEKCLLYVAMTRAKNYAYITCTQKRSQLLNDF